ncbi:MAG: hypothetical protein JNK82_14535, partial [Myxococcaceae bacterium]|nr:hypothetical protein [Myxococcaceae bacterium]
MSITAWRALVLCAAALTVACPEKKTAPIDPGPVGEDGKPTYKDYARFRRDMEIGCFCVELSGVTGADPAAGARLSDWLAAQKMGEDWKDVFSAV